MIYSMTAFARNQIQSNVGNLVCEIRSINHRYLEVSLHLSDAVRSLETPIREAIRQFVKRGKVECVIRYQAAAKDDMAFKLNTNLARALCRSTEEIAGLMAITAPVSPAEILRFPGVLETAEADANQLQDELLPLMHKTLEDLLSARGREGEELKQIFLQRMELMQVQINLVKESLPRVLLEQRERLLKRFADAKVELEPGRLEHEMVLFAQRMDVAEEIDRLETHLHEFRRILKEGGLVGRRLDFLSQELNREANTLGSKSMDSVLTHAAVEIKVLIEQVREQVQNVE